MWTAAAAATPVANVKHAIAIAYKLQTAAKSY